MVNRLTWTLVVVLLAAAMSIAHGAIAWAAEATGSAKPHLTARAVVTLARAELSRRGQTDNFRIRKPEYSSAQRLWWVFLIQRRPPYGIDGDMLAVVNDVSSKVCIQQAMMPPVPCT